MATQTSPAAQDYLKAILLLQWEEGDENAAVATSALATRLDVSAASATNMLKRLAATGLVEHIPYRGAGLTDAGRKVALEVVRHHRLLETYLAEALGMSWDQVHDEAEILEHVLSDQLEERIATLLGDPTSDPHGHPIPGPDLSYSPPEGEVLWAAVVGTEVQVDRVSDDRSDALRHLASLGIRPGTSLRIVDRGPVGGPLYVRVTGGRRGVHALSRDLAQAVWVS